MGLTELLRVYIAGMYKGTVYCRCEARHIARACTVLRTVIREGSRLELQAAASLTFNISFHLTSVNT